MVYEVGQLVYETGQSMISNSRFRNCRAGADTGFKRETDWHAVCIQPDDG